MKYENKYAQTLKCKKIIVNLFFLGYNQKFSLMSRTTAFWDR